MSSLGLWRRGKIKIPTAFLFDRIYYLGGFEVLGIHKLDIYRSCNIGIFTKANDAFVMVPLGLAPTKTEQLASFLNAKPVSTSIGGSRLLGPLIAMNNKGILVSKLADDFEVETLRRETGLRVERLESRFTSVGNMIAANDNGAVISSAFSRETAALISEILAVPVRHLSVAQYIQAGSMVATSNSGAIAHPAGTEWEIKQVGEILKVDVEACTVNNGVPYISSGIILNSKAAVVGSLTSGPELMILSRALKL
jgi:translation initiation factor 6